MNDIEQVMADIFGEDHEFWHPETEEIFTHNAQFLLDKGLTVTETAGILGSTYSVVSGEYGG